MPALHSTKVAPKSLKYNGLSQGVDEQIWALEDLQRFMDESPRKRRTPADKHHSARRLFSNPASERPRSKEFHTRRRLVLEDHHSETDPKRETNVVAKLMGLETLPKHSAATSVSISSQHVNPSAHNKNKSSPAQEVMRLHQLLKIKEPLLLRELLRETDDHPDPDSDSFPKPTLMQKFAGLVRRRHPELRSSATRPSSLSPVRSPRAASPCKSKRGLTVESAVKFLDSDDSSHQQQHVKKVAKVKQRRFSLTRSSSEPCMSATPSRMNLREGLARLSELSRRFGSGGNSGTSRGVNKSRDNLVRSKSDLGLGKSRKTDRQVGGLGLGLSQEDRVRKQDHIGFFHHHQVSLSKAGKTEPNTNTNNKRILRLFGSHRGKDNRARSDPLSDTGSSTSKSSSLVRALLRRRTGSLKPASWDHHLQRDKPVHGKRAESPEHEAPAPSSSSDELTSSSDGSQYCDEFSDDTDRASGSPSSSTSNSRSESNKSGQPSPVSVLEAVFVDELHSSLDSHSSCSSIEDSPDTCSTRARDTTPVSATSSENIINAILDISRIRCIDLSTIGLRREEEGRTSTTTAYVNEVLTASKFMSEQRPGGDWYLDGLPVNVETYGYLEKKVSGGCRSVHSRRLVFDCVDEALDVKVGWWRGRGGAVWAALGRQAGGRPRRVGKEELVAEVDCEIKEWSSMGWCTTDELVERDMRFGVGRWRDWNEEVEEIAREVECSILRRMIQELAMEVGALTCST